MLRTHDDVTGIENTVDDRLQEGPVSFDTAGEVVHRNRQYHVEHDLSLLGGRSRIERGLLSRLSCPPIVTERGLKRRAFADPQ